MMITPDIRFYDTSSLLIKGTTIFDEKEPFVISSITLEELEKIKTAFNKDDEIKFMARQLLHKLDECRGAYQVHIFKEKMLQPIIEKDLTISNDMKILATAIDYNNTVRTDEVIFVTNDLALKALANLFFGDGMIKSVQQQEDDYKGYIDRQLNNDEMAEFYSNQNQPFFNILPNEYLVIRDKENNIVDKQVWTGEIFRPISYEIFDSSHFGKIKPIDVQQQLVADSFTHNKITMIKGPAGSGKSLLALGFLFTQLEKSRIDKIIIFCNTVAARYSARLGFYPGSREEKLLDSQIGNLLISKIGSRIEVERLVEEEKLVLLPMSDIRGYDTSGMRAGIYLPEAQNLDINLMKLALQRIGEDSICIIDGDDKTQVDDAAFAGYNNGMKRVSKIFRGADIYGEITLNIIHRSQIAMLAEHL